MSLKKITCFVTGVFLMGLGLGVCNKAGLGIDCLGTFSSGLSITLSAALSVSNSLVNLSLAVIAWILDKRQVTLWSFLGPLIHSFGIETASWLPFMPDRLIVSLFLCLGGIIILSFGNALSIAADMGKTPYDALIYGIMAKTGKGYVWIRGILDLFWFLSGTLLGGIWGAGTLLIMLLSGRFIEGFRKRIMKEQNLRQ